MTKIVNALALIALFSARSAFAESGFFSPDSPAIPAAVKSVKAFKIIALGYVQAPLSKSCSSYAYAVRQNQLLSEPYRTLYGSEVKSCMAHQIAFANCKVHTTTSEGTLFLDQDGSHGWTALHVIDAQLATKHLNLSALKSKALSLAIVDDNANVIFQSPTEPARVEAIAPELVSQKQIPNFDDIDPDVDFVALRFARSLGAPLRWAELNSSDNSKTFATGFPMKTEDRVQIGAKDADGKNRYFTVGNAFPMIKALALMGSPAQNVSAQDILAANNDHICATNDGVDGLSGAPFLNTDGEVTGIFTISYPPEGHADKGRFSCGPSFRIIPH